MRKTFRDDLRVDDVSFTVHPGRVVALVGPNGAGKTSVIRMLLGLAAPDLGDVLIAGRPPRDVKVPARGVGAVLDAGGMHPARTGRQHLRIAAARGRVDASRVEEVLGEVDMTHAAGRRAGSYSLGMRQRIAVATALLTRPRVLVLDEPSNGLDPTGMLWLRRYLRTFADGGGAVLLSSHLLSDVREIADDVVVLTHGRVAAASPLHEVLATSDGDLEGYYLRLTDTRTEVR